MSKSLHIYKDELQAINQAWEDKTYTVSTTVSAAFQQQVNSNNNNNSNDKLKNQYITINNKANLVLNSKTITMI